MRLETIERMLDSFGEVVSISHASMTQDFIPYGHVDAPFWLFLFDWPFAGLFDHHMQHLFVWSATRAEALLVAKREADQLRVRAARFEEREREFAALDSRQIVFAARSHACAKSVTT